MVQEMWEYYVSHRAIVHGKGDLPYPGLGSKIDKVYELPAGMSKASLQIAILKENGLWGSYLKWNIDLSDIRIKPIKPGSYWVLRNKDGDLIGRIGDREGPFYLHGHKVIGEKDCRVEISPLTYNTSLEDFFSDKAAPA